MKKRTVGAIKEHIKVLYDTEVAKKLERMLVNEKRDRLRIIFEFEFKEDKIKDAVEIRHRRPWE